MGYPYGRPAATRVVGGFGVFKRYYFVLLQASCDKHYSLYTWMCHAIKLTRVFGLWPGVSDNQNGDPISCIFFNLKTKPTHTMLSNLPVAKSIVRKQWLALLLLGMAAQIQSFGQDNAQRQRISQLDTANLKKADFKLPKSAYLSTYAFDDTAKAIINLYFGKRSAPKTILYTNLVTVPIIRVGGQNQQPPPSTEVTYKPWVTPAAVVLAGVTLFSLIRLNKWSLKKLVKTLYAYQKTGALSENTRKKLQPKHFVTP